MPRRNKDIFVTIDKNSLRKALRKIDESEKAIQEGLSEGIYNWLEFAKVTMLEQKPWKDRTGRLRTSHEIEKIDDGWMLSANPERKGARLDYAPILEYGLNPRTTKDWSWFYKTIEQIEDQLKPTVTETINKKLQE